MTTDGELLRRYAEANSEEAFGELVRRHLNFVYSAALRQVNGDTHLAQDVAQTVFADLARKAQSLADRPILAGWLYTSTHFAAAMAVRTERRRHTREHEAQLMHELLQKSAPERDWSLLRPALDVAMFELNESDREAVLLRYFENRQHAEIADRLGISENAARMRVDRALEKLRVLLSDRGVSTTAALSAVITANAVQAAPVGLAVTISTAAALTGTTIAATATATAAKAIVMTTLQKALVTATVAVLAGAGIYEARQASRQRDQVQILQQQQAPLAERIQQLTRERYETASKLAASLDENKRLNQNTVELTKLRAEVTRLQAIQRQVAQLKNSSDPFIQSVLGLSARAAELNQHLEQMPDKRIPELQWLNENDWLNAAQEASFDTDASIRQALNRLRSRAKAHLYPILQNALVAYIKANNEQLPDDLSRLRPYFEKPVDDTILQRYKLLRTGSAKGLGLSDWVIAEKAPVDKDYDSRFKMGLYSMQMGSTGLGEAETFDDNP